jgi:hypothetical protein
LFCLGRAGGLAALRFCCGHAARRRFFIRFGLSRRARACRRPPARGARSTDVGFCGYGTVGHVLAAPRRPPVPPVSSPRGAPRRWFGRAEAGRFWVRSLGFTDVGFFWPRRAPSRSALNGARGRALWVGLVPRSTAAWARSTAGCGSWRAFPDCRPRRGVRASARPSVRFSFFMRRPRAAADVFRSFYAEPGGARRCAFVAGVRRGGAPSFGLG